MAEKKGKEKTIKSNKRKEIMKDPDKKRMIFRIINIILWIILIVWMVLVFADFIRVHNEKKPMFCWNEKVTEYDNGKVTQCIGLGYKVINYDRSDFKAIEFGPFWIKDRTAEKEDK